MADIKNFGIVGVGSDVQFGKGGGTFKWDTDGFISTSNGTTLADLDAATMNFTGLSGTGAVTVTDILDEDNMASDSATALATQQSIKAYVDSQVGATTLTGTGDSGAFTVDLDEETFGVFGGTNLTSTGSGSNVTVALDADISLTSVTATGAIEFGTLTDGTVIVNGFETTLTGTANIVPTSDAVKTYVDAQVTAADLDFAGDSGTGSVDLDSQVFTIAGGIGLSSTGSGQQLEIRLNNTSVTAGNYGSATQIPTFTVDQQGRLTAAANVALVTEFTLAGDTGTNQTISGGDTMTIAGGTNINTVGSNTDTLTVNLDGEIFLTNVTATGYIQGGFLTDGVATLSGGSLTDAVNGTFSGTVDAGTVEFDNLSGTGVVSVTDILDDDTMATASATTLATSESIKAYVDATATAADLDFQGDSGTGAVDLDSQALDIAGGLNLTTSAVSQTLTVAMDTTLTGMTAATFSGTVQAGTLTDGTASISSGAISGATDITATGTIQGGTLTDGTLTSTGGTISNGIGATFSGTVQAGTLTDGTASINGGAITGATDITATGTIQGLTLQDSILTINGGTITGGVQASFSKTVSAGNLDASGGLVTFNQLSDGTITIDAILDEDNMVSDSATAVPTQQSTKAYVDAQIALQGASMNIQGDTGTGSIVFQTETLDIAGTANEIETNFDNGTNTMTIGLPDDITMGNVTVDGTLFSNDITANTVEIDGDMTVVGDTVMQGNLTVQGNTTIVNSNTITTGDNVITLNADLPPTQAPSQNMGLLMNRGSSANVELLWLETLDYFVFRDENGVLQDVHAAEFNGTQFTGGNATISGDLAFGTLTDTGEGLTITKFVDEADGIANNDNDTTIPTSAAVIDYVTNNGGDGNLIRNGSVGTGATSVTIGTVPSVAGRTYYVEKVVIKVTVAFSGNSVDHIIVNENNGVGTQIVAQADADALNTGTYIIESDGATELTAGQTILLGFRDSGNNLVAPTAGALSCSVYYAWD